MLIPRYPDPVIEPKLTAMTLLNFPQQTIPCTLDTSNPMEEIQILITAQLKAAMTAAQVADGILNKLRRVRLYVVAPDGPRTVVDISGAALVELAQLEDLNVDGSTRDSLMYVASNNIPINTVVRTLYRVTLTHPRFTDALKMRTLLPVHLYSQAPILTLEFGQASDISSVGDPFTTFMPQVRVIRRRANAEFLAKGGGSLDWFIKSSLSEFDYGIGVSAANAEQKIKIPGPGQLSTMLLRFFKGNATLSRASIDDNTALGSETTWTLQRAGIPEWKFRLKDLFVENQLAQPLNSAHALSIFGGGISPIGLDGITTGAPAFVTAKNLVVPMGTGTGALGNGQAIEDPATVCLDFTGSPGREVYETGGFLDLTAPIQQNKITEVVGKVTTPANQGSIIRVVTRNYDDAINSLATL